MHHSSPIYVAGHRGLVGSAIVRCLKDKGFDNLILQSHKELDLLDQQAVDSFFQNEKPEYVFFAAAKVGGIVANNTFRAEFIRNNLVMQNNVLHQGYAAGVKRLLFLGSSCIYPKLAPQPMREEHLMTGPLEPTNSPYATAKIAGIEMCWAYNAQYNTEFVPVMPTNLYGPNDNFDLQNSHVLPALIRKFHLAKLAMEGDMHSIAKDEEHFGPIPDEILAGLGLKRMESGVGFGATSAPDVVLWGTGSPKREFLHVDDLAHGIHFLMEQESDTLFPPGMKKGYPSLMFNIGSGEDITIKELAELVAGVVGFQGQVLWDASKPDGTPRKLLDVSRMAKLGWKASIGLEEGIVRTYSWYRERVTGDR